ncbi:MAG: hypothetical protein ACXVFN_20525 [Solirubrobacteraceae bacterium]
MDLTALSPQPSRLRERRQLRLASLHARTRLAEHIEEAVDRADRPHSPFSASVPVCREAVDEARAALLDLAERLRAPRPVDPEGVRLARELLVDGAGPLYVPAWRGALNAAALRALRALDGGGGRTSPRSTSPSA